MSGIRDLKSNKKVMYFTGAIIIGVIILFVVFSIQSNISEKKQAALLVEEQAAAAEIVKQTPTPTPPPVAPAVINWQQYNYHFVDAKVKNILTSMIGNSGKTAFYLPPTGYINVTKGSNFGVAFAINNPNPSGENQFRYDWKVDDSVVENCGIPKEIAQSWIALGWTSWGPIPEGWIDHMTVYLEFPNDAPTCNVKYNFVITKDGILYDEKQIEFNIN